MTTTYIAAVDSMFLAINLAWKAGAAAIVGYLPEVRWQGIENPDPPDASKYWARVSQQGVDRHQASLSNNVNGPDKRRFNSAGLIFVQIFAPRSDELGFQRGQGLAVIARDALSRHTADGEVWFRYARVNELPPEEQWHRFNVVAEYEYDELG